MGTSGAQSYVPHIRPRLSSNSRPPGQTTVDEWHYADTRCASGARRAADFPHHHHAGFPKVIVKTRAGLVMVHVTTTLRLAPTHPFLKSSPTKSSLMSEGRRRQLVRASGGALQYGPDPVGGLADPACFSRMNRNSTMHCHQREDSSPRASRGETIDLEPAPRSPGGPDHRSAKAGHRGARDGGGSWPLPAFQERRGRKPRTGHSPPSP